MLTTLRHPRAFVAVIPWTICAGFVALLSAPCFADIAPESGLLAHVWGDTLITECDQIVRTTDADGPVEFLLFFMRGAYSWPGEILCIQSLQTELSWPETWQLIEFQPCGGGYGSLDHYGVTRTLRIDWDYAYYQISDLPGGVTAVAWLVMNVTGPGKLDVVGHYGQNPVELRHDCYGSVFVTYPVQAFAEAGMQCGYVSPHCGYRDNECQAIFDVPELLLAAPSGTAADSTVNFWATHYQAVEYLCPQEVDTHAPWCTAWIDPEYEQGEAHLHVMADAAELEPGSYETEIELYNTFWGVARCLPVRFTVEGSPSPASTATWGQIKALYR